MNFVGFELEMTAPHAREQAVAGLRNTAEAPMLVIDTCQRLECYGLGQPPFQHMRVVRTFDSAAAFERLARIGLAAGALPSFHRKMRLFRCRAQLQMLDGPRPVRL